MTTGHRLHGAGPDAWLIGSTRMRADADGMARQVEGIRIVVTIGVRDGEGLLEELTAKHRGRAPRRYAAKG